MDLSKLYLIGALNNPGRSLELQELFLEDMRINGVNALLRSSGPYNLNPLELAELSNPQRVITLVAVDLSSQRMISHVSASRLTSVARGSSAHVDLVVTHPEFLGRGVGKSLMIALLQRVQAQWHTRRVTLTSASDRLVARSMYEKLGFGLKGSDRFELAEGSGLWSQTGGQIEPPVFAFFNDTSTGHIPASDVREAVRQACHGQIGGIDPVEIRPYQKR